MNPFTLCLRQQNWMVALEGKSNYYSIRINMLMSITD